MTSYKDVYAEWERDPEAFWMNAINDVDWFTRPTKALDDSNAPYYRWFSDARTNTCWNAVDRHVEAGNGDQVAIIHDSPVTNSKTKITYAELQNKIAKLAGALSDRGVTKGDRVVIYMPMVPEALVAMLACARLGAVHSVVFGGFAAHELAVRIEDAKPKAVIAASCGIEPGRIVEYKPLLDGAIDLSAHKPDFTIILQRPHAKASMVDGRDFDWDAATEEAKPAKCVPVRGDDPSLYFVHVGHNWAAQRRSAPQCRAHGGAVVDNEEYLQCQTG